MKRPTLSRWTREGVTDLRESLDIFTNNIPWMGLFGGLVMAIAIGIFMALPWLSE